MIYDDEDENTIALALLECLEEMSSKPLGKWKIIHTVLGDNDCGAGLDGYESYGSLEFEGYMYGQVEAALDELVNDGYAELGRGKFEVYRITAQGRQLLEEDNGYF